MAETGRWRRRLAGHRADEVADLAQGVPGEPSAGRSSLRAAARRWLIVGLAAAGLVGLGVVIGWFALTRLVVSGSSEPEVVRVPIAEYLDADSGKATMPDVRGLSADAARAVLSDAGIPTGDVQVQDVPSALPLGVVAEQSPAFGTTPVGAVVLSVASKALVPDLVKEAEADAQSALVALGRLRGSLQHWLVLSTVAGW